MVHQSELPVMAVEEIDSWKICPTVLSMVRVTETDFKTNNIPQLKEHKLKSVDKKIKTKIKYIQRENGYCQYFRINYT